MKDVSFPTQITHKTTTSKLEVVHFHSFHSLPSILRQHEHTQVKNTRRQHGNIKCLTADPNEMNLKASDNKRGQMQEHISSHFGLDCVCASKPLWRAEDCWCGTFPQFQSSNWPCLSLESPGEGPFPESKHCSWVTLTRRGKVTEISAN